MIDWLVLPLKVRVRVSVKVVVRVRIMVSVFVRIYSPINGNPLVRTLELSQTICMTAVVMSTSGGISRACDKLLRQITMKLILKRGERYSDLAWWAFYEEASG